MANRKDRQLGIVFWASAGWVFLVIFCAIFAGVLPFQNPNAQTAAINLGPSWAHFLGTDALGRDIFSRIVFGARVSLVVGFGAVAIALVLGGIPGMFAGYRRGMVDTVTSSAFFVLLAFPALVAVIAIISFWGHTEWKIIIVLGFASSPYIFHVIRASTLSYSTRDFVTAARSLGATDRRILRKEIFPNILPTIMSFGLISVATIVVLEGSLAFLGLSVPTPTPSWGNMLDASRTGLLPGSTANPWLVIFPAIAMFLFLMALNLMGDRLSRYFDVSQVKL